MAGARRAAALGYDGKWAIHPAQVDLANEVFTPPAAEVEQARRVLGALDEAAAAGRGASQLDGRMIDAASARMARNVVETADAIAAVTGLTAGTRASKGSDTGAAEGASRDVAERAAAADPASNDERRGVHGNTRSTRPRRYWPTTGWPSRRGGLAYSPEQATYRASEIGGRAVGGEGPGPRRVPRAGGRHTDLQP